MRASKYHQYANMNRLWTDLEIQYLTQNYSSTSNQSIASTLNRSKESIKQKARHFNLSKNEEYLVSLRASSGLHYCLAMAKSKTESAELKTKFHFVFDNLENEGSAYWLGFLAADVAVQSHNNTICLNLGAKDLEHLKLFSKFIGCSNPIMLRKRGTYSLTFTSRQIHEKLTSAGIVTNRAASFNLPSIPSFVFHHFLRGFIDGDGWVSIGKSPVIGFIASHTFCLQVENLVNKSIALPGRIRYSGSNLYEYNVYGRNRAEKLKSFLMSEATIFLERKWDRSLALPS